MAATWQAAKWKTWNVYYAQNRWAMSTEA